MWTLPLASQNRHNVGSHHTIYSVPQKFRVSAALFVLFTGALPQLLHASINGLESKGSEGAFIMAMVAGLIYDLLRILPLIWFRRSHLGLLHPLILAVFLWPILTALPNVIESFGGYAGLLSGERLITPYYYALVNFSADQIWLEIARTNALNCLSLVALFVGYSVFTGKSRPVASGFMKFNTLSLRRVLVCIIIANFVGVLIFIEYRGGINDHLYSLGGGRFRTLAGLGSLLALFDAGFIALLLWIANRPQDASNPLFIALVPLVALQQFLTAGSRSAAIAVLVMAGLTWSMRVRRIPWRLAMLFIPVAFVSLGIFNLARTAAYTNQTASEALSTTDLANVLERTRTEFAQRRALSGIVPVIADGHRVTDGPLFGATYAAAVFALVPRAIWADKPRGPGSFYTVAFLGEEREGQAVPIGPVAEAYWNFGIAGVILAFFLQGFVLRYAQSLYEANSDNGLAIVFFAHFMTQFQIYTDALVAIQQMIVTMLFVSLLIRIFARRDI
jgi:hypothetical protein